MKNDQPFLWPKKANTLWSIWFRSSQRYLKFYNLIPSVIHPTIVLENKPEGGTTDGNLDATFRIDGDFRLPLF